MSFVSAGVLLFGPPQDPSKAVASRRLLPSLLLGILRKLTGRGGAEDRLLQPLGRACLSVAGILFFFFGGVVIAIQAVGAGWGAGGGVARGQGVSVLGR